VRALDGCFFGRLSPQRPDEQARMQAAGLLPARWLMIDELVPATHVACSVTGITTCALVAGIQEQTHEHVTETIVFWGPGAASVRMHRIHPRRI
jgi:fructose-1,6-bisphosphatase/sedoheptulose 1,7-bisphosphatase-like protein